MVKMADAIELRRRQQPEVEECLWEVRMHVTSCETDERRKRKCHLFDLGLQFRVVRAVEEHFVKFFETLMLDLEFQSLF